MSQIIKPESGGGGSEIVTINGDSGSITGSTVTIFSNNATNNAGSTVKFINSGTVSTLELTDNLLDNTFLGNTCGNLTVTGGLNTGIGQASFQHITTGFENCAVGALALNNITTGNSNTAMGYQCLDGLTTGVNNTAYGETAGKAITQGSFNSYYGVGAGQNHNFLESSNICIGNAGVTGESHVTRIGTQGSGDGQQDECFIAGIIGNTVSNTEMVTINSSTGQLGVQAQTYFQAYLTSPQTVAGGNTTTTIIFDTTISNVGSAYNAATGVFTAPATGFYGFSTTAYFNNLSSLTSHTQTILGYTGSIQSLRLTTFGSGAESGGTSFIATASWSMPMSAGDTVKIQPFADGTGNYQIFGAALSSSAFNTSSTFSGYRIA